MKSSNYRMKLVTYSLAILLLITASLLPATKSQTDIIPLDVTLDITTSGGVNRFFTLNIGDTLIQLTGPVYVVSSSTSAMFTTRESFTGSVSGTLTGLLTSGIFNTIWVDITTTSMKGLTTGHVIYNDPDGTIEVILALDVDAQLSGGTIVGATLKGYAFSKSSTGAYAGQILLLKLEGRLTGPNTYQLIGKGWLFANCESVSVSITGSRAGSPGEIRNLALLAGDIVNQFTTADIVLPADASTEFTTKQTITGTSSGEVVGSFIADSNSLIISSGTLTGRGYSVVRIKFTSTIGNLDGFLLLDNTNFGEHNGFLVTVKGSGEFERLRYIGSFTGQFINPPDFFDYVGTASLRKCSLPPAVAGEIIEYNPISLTILMILKNIETIIFILLVATFLLIIKRVKNYDKS